VKIASMEIAPLFKEMIVRGARIVFMSGTLTPDFFSSRAGLANPSVHEFSLPGRSLMVCPAYRVPRTGKRLSSYYKARDDEVLLSGFGDYLHAVLPYIPHGSIAFFPSYSFRDSVIKAWEREGYLDYDDDLTLCFFADGGTRVPAFIERPDDKAKAMINDYKEATARGKALLLSIFRGGASEGEDFPGDQCRGVFCIGLPLRNVSSPEIKYKMHFYDAIRDGFGSYWLRWDAMTIVSQAIGRGIRDPFHDSAFAVLLDSRYCDASNLSLLSSWIRDRVDPDYNTSTPSRVASFARSFFSS
jgi:Rad3-related DNA helicase